MTQNLEVMANKEAMMMSNSRDKALELVEEGLVSADDMLIMALKYMSTDDVEDMLDCNELSDRFIEEEDEDENTQDDEDLFRDVDMMIEEDADA
tara:strand:- start:243 stop:524 length:282 start_codon:yes stop_codon:yes gene_type:complete